MNATTILCILLLSLYLLLAVFWIVTTPSMTASGTNVMPSGRLSASSLRKSVPSATRNTTRGA